MLQSISLLQLNIETNKHFDRIIPFLAKELPDVVCVQELYEPDIVVIAGALGAEHVFVPRLNCELNNKSIREGIGIFSRLPIKKSGVEYYVRGRTQEGRVQDRAVAYCDVEKGGNIFCIATTHFTWTPDGNPDDFQRQDVRALLQAMEKIGECVLCGDFNAPRGGEIFGLLANKFKDNVPPQHITSLDRKLHRAGHLDRMVDGIFSTPQYGVRDVEMICGLSDHCALKAGVTSGVSK